VEARALNPDALRRKKPDEDRDRQVIPARREKLNGAVAKIAALPGLADKEPIHICLPSLAARPLETDRQRDSGGTDEGMKLEFYMHFGATDAPGIGKLRPRV
jgi:hypothetical protein